MNILVGSANWTDRTLIACKRFYPRGVSSAEARLRYYASQFPLVEVDSSYYALPSEQNARLWVERTPAHFVFDIKAFRLFTGHPAAPEALPGDLRLALGPTRKRMLYYRDLPEEIRDELWRRYRAAIAPLRAAGKLGVVLFQFAPWILANRAGRALIEHCAEKMAGDPVAVELRNRSWFDGAQAATTLAFERELGVVHVVVDQPQGFENCVPAVWETTRPELAVLRLHGRNAAAWNAQGASSTSRFDYVYSAPELAEIAERVRALARQAARVHVVFNTNFEDLGQRNAQRLLGLL